MNYEQSSLALDQDTGLRIGKYRFHCRMNEDAILPPYKGSTFRGMFGYALRRVVCALKLLDCDKCLLATNCVYARIFESPNIDKPINLRSLSLPRPVVFEPPEETKEVYHEGDEFSFSIILFGDYNTNLAHFIYAVSAFGEAGIGKKNSEGNRGSFTLEKVEDLNGLVYDGINSQMLVQPDCELVFCPSKEKAKKEISHLTIQLNTPLRIKFEKRFQAELPFHVFIRAALRRISAIYICFGSGEPLLPYKELVQKAQNIKIASSDIHWFDWERYSNRQDQKMLMGGMLGSVTYEGDLGEFIPLIELAVKLHVGKQSTFGLGNISLRY